VSWFVHAFPKTGVSAGLDETLERIHEATEDLIAKLRTIGLGKIDNAA
jgi:hypothetical protein